MDKQNYYNTIGLQVESLFELAPIQVEKCFDEKKLSALLPLPEAAALKRLIVAGCGDSYSAAGAMAPVIRKLACVSCASPDPMELCSFYTDEDIRDGCKPEEVLVVAISASGGSVRIVEMLERAKAAGVRSMLITNNPESKGAKAAELVYCVETPELCNTPGLRSYFASLTALAALASYIGGSKGVAEPAVARQAILDYVSACQPRYQEIDGQMFELAQRWSGLEKFEIVGDESEFFSAQFVEEKFIECASVHASHADSEDWCHINFFLREPETVGTIFQVNAAAPDLDRIAESVRVSVAIGRPTLVVTDADCDFAEGAAVCRLPKAPECAPWALLMMDHAPGSLLAAYCAALAGKLFFSNRYDFRTRTWKM